MKNRDSITTPSISDIANKKAIHSKHSSWKKWLIILVIVAIAGGFAWQYYNQISATPKVVYQTVSVNRGDLTVSVTATGNLEPVNQVDIGTELSGTVEEVYVDNNDVVKKGQELARLNTEQLEDAVAKAEAALMSAKSNVAQAEAQITQAAANIAESKASVEQTEANALQSEAQVEQAAATTLEARTYLNRLQQLNKTSGGKLPAKGDLDSAIASWKRALAAENAAKASVASARANISGTKASAASIKAEKLNAEANLESAKAGVMEATATLRSARTSLGKAIITSPIDGVVLDRAVEPGQTVAASLSAPTLFTLAEDLSMMELEVSVDEADVGQVKIGQVADFSVDAWAGRSYPAKITRVSLGSTLTDNVVSYLTELAVTNTDLTLRPGMTATANIITNSQKDVLLVPTTALRFTPTTHEKSSDRKDSASSSEGGILSKLTSRGPPRQKKTKRSEATTTPQNSEQTIWVLENGRPKAVTVKTGISDGKNTEIVAGDLSKGMQVITGSSGGNK